MAQTTRFGPRKYLLGIAFLSKFYLGLQNCQKRIFAPNAHFPAELNGYVISGLKRPQ
jgi:hypothetical protein